MVVWVVVNPISGTLNKAEVIGRLKASLESTGHSVNIVHTKKKGDGVELTKDAVRHGADIVVAVGGDGTVNEVGAALCDTDVALAILPCGSGNGLARHLNIPVDVDGAIKIIIDGNIRKIDYCTMNDRKFFCTFGIGFDAKVSLTFSKQDHRGLAMYVKSAIREYINYAPSHYKIATGELELEEEAFIIAGCNASQYGNNAYIAPKAHIDDGFLDLIIVHKGTPITRAFMGVELFTGTIDQNTLIQTIRVEEVTVECLSSNRVAVHIDGEPLEISGPIKLKCHHQKLNVLAPGKDDNFKPFITPMNNFVKDTGIAIKNLLKPGSHSEY